MFADGFPVTAVIAVPRDEKSGTLLQGRYLGEEELVQIVHPSAVMDELLATILTVQSYVITAVVVVSVSTLALAALALFIASSASAVPPINIEKNPDGSGWAPLTTTAPNVTAYLDTSLAVGTVYHYRVRASSPGSMSSCHPREGELNLWLM